MLLLADGYSAESVSECLIEMVEADDLGELLSARPNHKARGDCSVVDHSSEKWLKYFLKQSEIDLMRALKGHDGVVGLAYHADIDVGVVTGRNEFFVVSKDKIREFELGRYTVPLIGRSSQLRGAIIDVKEWESLADEGKDMHLLMLGAPDKPPLNAGAKRYVKAGEAEGYHLGYKCSIRSPWHLVPSVWAPDALFFRQIYDFPRAVLNEARAVPTDTVHRVRCRRDPAATVENVYTHLTAASAEIEGRSYGGGVLELEPTEAERLLTPKALRSGIPLAEIDRMVRGGKVAEVLAENDRAILAAMGLSGRECATLKSIWEKMRERRLSRKKIVR